MVSDQAVLQASDPTKSVGIYAPSSHRGVNEKQPLRGTILETRLIIDLCFYSCTIGFKDFYSFTIEFNNLYSFKTEFNNSYNVVENNSEYEVFFVISQYEK